MKKTHQQNQHPTPHPNPRHVAWQILVRLEQRAFRFHADDELHAASDRARLSDRDRRLAYELLFGCLRHRTLLEHHLSNYSSRPVDRLDTELRCLLLMGLYQLMFLDRIPPHAAVNETVAMCKRMGKPQWARFANAVLRNSLRDKKRVEIFPDGLAPACSFSHPRWLVDRWTRRLGSDTTREILSWNNRTPLHYARIRLNREFVLNELGPDFAESALEFGADAAHIFSVSKALASESFRQGLIYLMEPWSMKVARHLPVQDGWQVLDMCAAPGGKSIALADAADVQITAADNSSDRTELLKQNLSRCKVSNVRTVVMDSREIPKRFGPDKFDAVLLDAPCSSLGVIQRHPEIRWRVREEGIATLATLQAELLDAAIECVKPGGYLLYAVCTFALEETENIIRQALSEHSDLVCEKTETDLPGEHNTDGGFYALLRKRPP